MAPLQFKDYVTSQRITRWKIEKDVTHLNQKVQNVLNSESKDGRAQNVARFSSEVMRTVRPGDSFKAESCKKVIQQMLDEVTVKLQEIVNLRSNLFDKNLIVKQWRANELKFLDSKKSSLEELKNTLQKTQEAIITNANLLKRRTNSTTERDAEAKRQKRSSAKNARKSVKEKEARLENKAKDVLRLLTNGMLTLDAIKNREDSSIHLADIDKSCQLAARFHAKAMTWLIENGYFSSDSLEFATQLSKNLTIQLQKSKELTNARQRKSAAKNCQKSLFDCFCAEERVLGTNRSSEVESSDDD